MALLTTLLSLSLLAPRDLDFTPYGPYDPAVTRPESVLGYGPGDKHTFYRDQERVVLSIARTAPKRVKVFEIGSSWEGRPLRVLAISSERNIARLESLRQQMQKIAAGDDSPETRRAIEEMPTFVWVNETIHGNESASFESGMWLLYNLAASRNAALTSALEQVVVLVNPVYNPDGHERFAVWNRSVAVGSDHPGAYETDEPDWVHGRTNHYRFDMNRDRIAFSQAETRAEVTEFLRWHPQVYIDQHGQTNEYFFPPTAMSVHPAVRERYNRWTEVFGRAYGRAFDRQGWLYFVRDDFDFYAASFLDTYTSFTGAIGMTHETDGGRMLRRRKDDGTVLTLAMGMAKHLTTALETVLTASRHRQELVRDYAAFRRRSVTGEHAGKFQRVVAVADDPRALVRLQQHLARAGVVARFAEASFTQPDAHDYWSKATGPQHFPKGSLIIDMAQPEGVLAKALLEPGQGFEPKFTEEQLRIADRRDRREPFMENEFSGFYDLTGWSLIYNHQVRAWWCESAPKVGQVDRLAVAGRTALEDGTVGWAVTYRDLEDVLGAFKLAAEGVRIRVATRDMQLGGETFARGTFLFLKGRNEDDLGERLRRAFPSGHTQIRPLKTAYPDAERASPGSMYVRLVRQPKVGIVFGADNWTTAHGWAWYLMEQEFGIEFVPLAVSALNGDLSEFTCILFPQGRYGSIPGNVREWVSEGGCAVVLGSPGWALGEGKFASLPAVDLDGDKPIRSVPGAYFLGELDPASVLSFGYAAPPEGKIPFAFIVDGNRFYRSMRGGNPVATFPDRDGKLLSGWSWPENSEPALRNAVAVWDQPIGNGRAVIFMWDPTERAMFPGQHKLLLNAMLLGPG